MSTMSSQLDTILATRATRLKDIDAAIAAWKSREVELEGVLAKMEAAERVNPDLHGASARLRSAAEAVRGVLADYALVRVRFARETLCIGIGGTAGMGKSTFLQSATGLSENEIPTGDLLCTTAVRSLIENSLDEKSAIADFHSPNSFLDEVIAPMCSEIGIPAPSSMVAFRSMPLLEIPQGVPDYQKKCDILTRLKDAQSHLAEYESSLTGRRGVSIPLAKLRPFVAYPADGTKAGPFLAIANLVVKVPFPATDFVKLRVVDLPGIGEAGINLAKAQTESLRNTCDITLLVKKVPADGRVEWMEADTTALDAMKSVVQHVEDQTKFTMVLFNDASTPERLQSCVGNFRKKVDRPFETIECDAHDKDKVTQVAMPRILDFLANNLPAIDTSILSRIETDAAAALDVARCHIRAASEKVRAVAPVGIGDYDFGRKLKSDVSDVFKAQLKIAREKAQGNDAEWDDEVNRIHASVIGWVKNGCGFGSRDSLLKAIDKEVFEGDGRPRDIVNECRVKFRNEWEAMDLHLSKRIATLLSGVMDALQAVLNDFVPQREGSDPLPAVRSQIEAFADRIDARTTNLGDNEALRELSRPLRRIAEFDLQFRFHLEPMLHATTHLVMADELPRFTGEEAAKSYLDALEKKLLEAADAYAAGMRKSGTGNSAALERKKRLFEKAIPDASVRADVIAMLEQSMGSAQSFCPNRIFAAVVETFADAFIRSKNSDKAFQILAHEWRDELTPAPDEKTRLTNAAAGAVAALSKAF